MQQFIILDNNIKTLNTNQVLIHTTQKAWSDKNGVCNLTQEQIANCSGVPYRTVVKNMNKDYYKTVRCVKTKVHIVSYMFRNVYNFDNAKGFFMIKRSFMNVKASKEALAFVLKLKTVCFRDTNKCAYNKSQLARLFNMSWNSINKYINDTVKAGLIKLNKNCIEITCSGITAKAFRNKKASDGDNVYNVIKYFCEAKGVKVPYYSKRVVNELNTAWKMYSKKRLNHTPTDEEVAYSLYNRLNTVCRLKVERTYSLSYFAKILLDGNVYAGMQKNNKQQDKPVFNF